MVHALVLSERVFGIHMLPCCAMQVQVGALATQQPHPEPPSRTGAAPLPPGVQGSVETEAPGEDGIGSARVAAENDERGDSMHAPSSHGGSESSEPTAPSDDDDFSNGVSVHEWRQRRAQGYGEGEWGSEQDSDSVAGKHAHMRDSMEAAGATAQEARGSCEAGQDCSHANAPSEKKDYS